eukprot:Hpha_TRINITY_DN2344_c0_g1::TRINITY_DN2344_c0_g1_i1::g.449::m.449
MGCTESGSDVVGRGPVEGFAGVLPDPRGTGNVFCPSATETEDQDNLLLREPCSPGDGGRDPSTEPASAGPGNSEAGAGGGAPWARARMARTSGSRTPSFGAGPEPNSTPGGGESERRRTPGLERAASDSVRESDDCTRGGSLKDSPAADPLDSTLFTFSVEEAESTDSCGKLAETVVELR